MSISCPSVNVVVQPGELGISECGNTLTGSTETFNFTDPNNTPQTRKDFIIGTTFGGNDVHEKTNVNGNFNGSSVTVMGIPTDGRTLYLRLAVSRTGDFTDAQYVDCTVTASGTMTAPLNNIYVATNGSDSNSGTTEASAFRTMQRAFNSATAGTKINVKAGNYGNSPIFYDKTVGTAANPVIVEGYQNTPGDNPQCPPSFNNTTALSASLMPLFDGGANTNNNIGLLVRGPNVRFKNLQITRWRIAATCNQNNVELENLVCKDLGDPSVSYDGYGITFAGCNNSVIRNCKVVDCNAEALTLGSDSAFCTVTGNKVWCDGARGTGLAAVTHYYMIVSESSDNTITNNRLERIGSLGHDGHGFTVKWYGERNIFDGNTSIGIVGGGCAARHQRVRNNTWRNHTITGGNGLIMEEGAQDNLFEDFNITNVGYGIWTFALGEDGTNTDNDACNNNTLRRINVTNATTAAISWRPYGTGSTNNIMTDCVFDTSPYVMAIGQPSSGNQLNGCTFRNISQWGVNQGNGAPANWGFTTSGSTVVNCGFTSPPV